MCALRNAQAKAGYVLKNVGKNRQKIQKQLWNIIVAMFLKRKKFGRLFHA